MNDYQAIQELMYRYARAADRRDYPAFDHIFTADALLVIPGLEFAGLESIKQAMAQLEQFKRTLHTVHNLLVDVGDDRAEAEVYCVASHIYDGEDGEMKQDWGLRYLDRLVGTASGWRIQRRELIREWVQDLPLTTL